MKNRRKWFIILSMGLDYLINVRRALHALAEGSGQEQRTSDFLYAHLRELGYRPKRVATGMFCDCKGREKRHIALRADMDALPLTEKGDCPFAAKNGFMHACGHDGHMAMLLAAAKAAKENAPEPNVRFLFQFGEEGGTAGAKAMIEGGALCGIDEIYALHMCPELEIGKLATRDGALFAGSVSFDLVFYGKSSHCASPECGHDALAAASAFVCGAQRTREGREKHTLLHVGKLIAGSARNVVAASAECECTLRYFDGDDVDRVMMKLEKLCEQVDGSFGTEHRLTVRAVYPPLVNSPACVARIGAAMQVQEAAPRFTGEDFAFYLQQVPGAMVWLGCRDENHTSPLHSDTFGFDERALLKGEEMYMALMYPPQKKQRS